MLIMNYRNIFFVLFLLLSTCLAAQKGFRGSALMGITLSQIDGDNLIGYNKAGLTAGLKVGFDLSPNGKSDFMSKVEGNVEIVYSQRGSGDGLFGKMTYTELSYVELPVYLSIKDWYIEKDDYYKMRGHAGLSFGNLISSDAVNTDYDSDVNLFNSTDISWLTGVSYGFTKKLTLTARFTRSFSKILKKTSLPGGSLIGYYWTIRTEFNF